MKIVSVEQMQQIERETDAAGVSYAEMMESAGHSVAQAIKSQLDVDGRSILILVGPGNNGGDGLVAGRYLAQDDAAVAFYLLHPRDATDPNYDQVLKMGLPVILAAQDPAGKALLEAVAEADVIIDALLGTGVDRPIEGRLAQLLQTCAQAIEENRQRRTKRKPELVDPLLPAFRGEPFPLIVAVDCASGLNCDTGSLDPIAIPADLTVTFATPKVGQFIFPGARAVGSLRIADIGVPADLPALQQVELELVTADLVRALLPERPLDAHKGTFGKLMIAAGSINYPGAIALAGQAAYRAGAGLVTLAMPTVIQPTVAANVTEATYIMLPHQLGAITEGAVSVLLEALTGYDALLIGPGLGRDEKTRLFLQELLVGEKPSPRSRIGFLHEPVSNQKSIHHLPPLIIDADGLNLLSELTDWQQLLPANSILTPHPGEMERLLGTERGEWEQERIQVARRAAAEWGHLVVLKGAFTIIAAPDGRVRLVPVASPALATAGSGDVLAGTIAAFLAGGMDPFSAATAGCFVHGAAGQQAAGEIGERGVIAGDLPFFVAGVLAELE